MIDTESLKKHVYDIIGAIHEVHRELGVNLNEFCYQEGLEMELTERQIEFKREVSFHPTYHNKKMKATYRLDFLCKSDVIIECKAVEELTQIHRAQLFNYMRLTNFPCGILVNFSPIFAEIERYFFDAEINEIINVDGIRLSKLPHIPQIANISNKKH